jgi:hypothetical protein
MFITETMHCHFHERNEGTKRREILIYTWFQDLFPPIRDRNESIVRILGSIKSFMKR